MKVKSGPQYIIFNGAGVHFPLMTPKKPSLRMWILCSFWGKCSFILLKPCHHFSESFTLHSVHSIYCQNFDIVSFNSFVHWDISKSDPETNIGSNIWEMSDVLSTSEKENRNWSIFSGMLSPVLFPLTICHYETDPNGRLY